MAKYLILGGVAGGATTAARLRRNDESAEIILFERGADISYANCGLPYYIGGTIQKRDALFLQTPESFNARFNVDVRVRSEVIGINTAANKVTVRKLADGSTYEESYDVLVVSPGAEPVRPPIEGIDDPAIFTLRNVPDTDRIANYINEKKPRHATVVGAGFIGLEMAENLHARGIQVTIVEMADQVMTVLDYEMAAQVHQHLKAKNVEFYLSGGVASFSRTDGNLAVHLKSGRAIQTDMVIFSIGVRPDTKLMKESGIALSDRGSIIVDEYLRTNVPNVYALGDAIVFPNPITGKPLPVYLAGPANKQGRIVANNIVYGNKEKYRGSIATAVAKVFDLTVASTGLSEKVLKAEGIDYRTTMNISGSHAGYYPGATMISIKLLYSPADGRVLGAQAVGYDGVDSRINMIATVIGMNGTVYDLRDIEHAYAPPFSSAKDPVNMAGFIAENVLAGRMKVKHWDEVSSLDRSEWVMLDVRTAEEHALGHIGGSVNIPVDSLRKRINEVPKGKKILVYCAVGLRGYVATRMLEQHGFADVYNLTGGYKTYAVAVQKQGNEDVFSSDGCTDESCVRRETEPSGTVRRVDACGLQCPGPIMRLRVEMEKAVPGDVFEVTATDAGFYRDAPAWCAMTGNTLVSVSENKGVVTAVVKKGGGNVTQGRVSGDAKTIVLFSDDLDRALASMVIANGAASTGSKVTVFFTFWGLNLLKKRGAKVKKDFMGRMFSWMMPRDSRGLKLSKMHMMGMGTKMMRWRMKSKKVDSLEAMIGAAKLAGVEFIACQMSMDVMGVKAEELMDGVRIGGVATYLQEAGQGNVNLFI